MILRPRLLTNRFVFSALALTLLACGGGGGDVTNPTPGNDASPDDSGQVVGADSGGQTPDAAPPHDAAIDSPVTPPEHDAGPDAAKKPGDAASDTEEETDAAKGSDGSSGDATVDAGSDGSESDDGGSSDGAVDSTIGTDGGDGGSSADGGVDSSGGPGADGSADGSNDGSSAADGSAHADASEDAAADGASSDGATDAATDAAADASACTFDGGAMCGGKCVDTNTDPANCGGCGDAGAEYICAATQACTPDGKTTGHHVTSPGCVVETAIAAGVQHACAILVDETVRCWGANDAGELGNTSAGGTAEPEAVTGLTAVQQVAAGNDFTCALTSLGGVNRIYCWGDNSKGQLGSAAGSPAWSATPTEITFPGGDTPEFVSAGGQTACAVIGSGGLPPEAFALYCWGDNTDAKLGSPTDAGAYSATPIAVTLSGTVWGVAVGNSHTCAIVEHSGVPEVECWGSNALGQLGNGTTSDGGTGTAARVGTFQAYASNYESVAGPVLAAGANHTCVITQTTGNPSGVSCWGDNSLNQLGGAGDAGTIVSVSAYNSEANAPTTIGAGGEHTCAVSQTGAIKCWGDNSAGELGNGSHTGTSATPVAATGMTTGTMVAAGVDYSCAVDSSGVFCWGTNTLGQLGDGTLTSPEATPAAVVW